MAYAPGISYRGDLHISQGFRGLGRGIENVGAMMGQQKEEDKQLQQDAKTFDFLAKQGYIDAADLMGMSPREKSQQVRGLMDATRIGSQIQQMDYQKLMGQNLENQMNAPPWQPSPIDFDGDGTPEMLMTSPSSAVPVPRSSAQLMGARDLNGDGVPDHIAQQNGFYGTWDPKAGAYTGWKPMDQGVDLSKLSPEDRRWAMIFGKGFQRDYSQVPEYSIESLMGGPGAPAPAPNVDPSQESSASPAGADVPPMEGARKAPDGKWYIQKDGKWFRVEL